MIPRPILVASPTVLLLFACGQTDDSAPATDTTEDPAAALIARGESLEIPGKWASPPGDPLVHATAGFAKILCSNVFLSGLDPEFAAASTGFFSSPPELRSAVTDTVVDYENRRVHLTLPDGTVRSAKVHGDQGCVALPVGESEPYYEAVDVIPKLADPATTPWPLGDVLPDDPFPDDVDMNKVAEAVAAAFDPPEALTAAFVVTHRGRLLGERYREGISHDTPLESWSMGKSLTGTLMGVLIHKGVGAGVGGGRPPELRRRVLLGEPGRAVPGPPQRLLHGGGRWPEHDRDPVARHGGGAPGALQRLGAGPGRAQTRARDPDGGCAGERNRPLTAGGRIPYGRGGGSAFADAPPHARERARQDSNLGPSA